MAIGRAYVNSDLGQRQRDIEGRLDRARRILRTETLAGRPRAQRIVESLEHELERVICDQAERARA